MAPVFFTDRDLGKQFPTILRDAGLTVERHADHFSQDCTDPDWLRDVGRRGWIAITHDGRIRYKINELAAVIEHRVSLLVMIGHVPNAELAHNFVATQARILGFIDKYKPPYIAKVYRHVASGGTHVPMAPGRIELWYPPKRLR